jgi:DNA polymerase-3 subunit epsilon
VNDQDKAILWAREQLAADPASILILDSETTDLGGEIIDLAIIDLTGATVFQSLFNPLMEIAPDAARIHGLTRDKLKDEPRFGDLRDAVGAAIEGKKVLIYNAAFDNARLYFTCCNHDVDPFVYQSDCVMLWYAQWVGEWNDYRHNYRWQRLQGGDHSALGDCVATLAALKEMAAAKLQSELDELPF